MGKIGKWDCIPKVKHSLIKHLNDPETDAESKRKEKQRP